MTGFGFLISQQLLPQFLFPFLLFFFHLSFQIFRILFIQILPKFLIIVFFAFEFCQFGLPSLFKFLIIAIFLLFLSFSSLNLIFQGLLVLLLEYLLLLFFFPLDFGLLFLELVDLGVESFDFVVFDLTHLEGLLLVEFLTLLYLLVDEVLLSLLGQVLDDFCISRSFTLFFAVLFDLLFLFFFLEKFLRLKFLVFLVDQVDIFAVLHILGSLFFFLLLFFPDMLFGLQL